MPHIHRRHTPTKIFNSGRKGFCHKLDTKITANMLPFWKDCSTISHRLRDNLAQLDAVVLGGTQSLPGGPLFFKAGLHLFENPRSIAHHQLHWACFQRAIGAHMRPRETENNPIHMHKNNFYWLTVLKHIFQIIFFFLFLSTESQLFILNCLLVCSWVCVRKKSIVSDKLREIRFFFLSKIDVDQYTVMVTCHLREYLSDIELLPLKFYKLSLQQNSYPMGTEHLKMSAQCRV